MHSRTDADFSNEAARWAAVQAGTAAAEGHFWTAVRTTGIYCQPSCPARLPHRTNVAFYDSREAAEQAGFRPCRRCRPDLPAGAKRQRARGPHRIEERVASLDWTRIGEELDAGGCGLTGPLLTEAECRALAAGYDEEGLYRSRVVMQRHGFGLGEYRYFGYPLPPLVEALRRAAYPRLAVLANTWMEALGKAGASRPSWKTSSRPATPPARPGRRPWSCATVRATTTACTRTSMVTWPFPCSSPSCWTSPAWISRAASSS